MLNAWDLIYTFISNYHVHISYWNKVTFDTEFLEKPLAVLKLESQINCFYYSIQITLFWFISLYSFLKNSSDKLETTTTFYPLYVYCIGKMSTHKGISGKIQLQGVTRLSDENFLWGLSAVLSPLYIDL